ncbi:MAG: N-acetyl-alpha-D-muramate 1-phosphate uridylyltransferase [Verrucomicrobiota bacterium]|jgi:NDP-sugar pyrophosphorylase family protein
MKPRGERADLAAWPVAILAGGLATRLGPVTEKLPKALVPVAGETFLAHQLRLLHSAGLRRIVICAGHLGDMVAEEFGDGSDFDMQITYSFDGPRLLGTGGALKQALPLLGERFFVLYGDSYLPIDYRSVAEAYLRSGKPALMTVFKNEGQWDTSNVWYEDGAIRLYDKSAREEKVRHIDYGLGILSSKILRDCPASQFDLAALYQQLVAQNQLAGYEVTQRFYEIGSPEGLAELDEFLRRQPALTAP